jgi:hypothetical protein
VKTTGQANQGEHDEESDVDHAGTGNRCRRLRHDQVAALERQLQVNDRAKLLPYRIFDPVMGRAAMGSTPLGGLARNGSGSGMKGKYSCYEA